MVKLEKDQKFGYANEKGKIVIPFEFDEASGFKDGKASVVVYSKNSEGVVIGSNKFTINKKGKRID